MLPASLSPSFRCSVVGGSLMGADNYIDKTSGIFPRGGGPTRPEAIHKARRTNTQTLRLQLREGSLDCRVPALQRSLVATPFHQRVIAVLPNGCAARRIDPRRAGNHFDRGRFHRASPAAARLASITAIVCRRPSLGLNSTRLVPAEMSGR